MRLLCLLLACGLWLSAQPKLTVNQLLGMVRSSLKLKHPDKQVGEYLRKIQLTEKLDDRTIETLLGEGIGPKTAEALKLLRDATENLEKPQVLPPKPAAPVIPAPPLSEVNRVIDKSREYALAYDKGLPNFICVQVTRRFIDPAGLELWNKLDTITAKLSYFDHQEQKQVMFVNNKYTDIDYAKLGGGATSTGEFGSLMREIFEPASEAMFGWERWATLRGRLHYVINYRVLQSRSKWSISHAASGQQIIPAYHGLVYVDKDYLSVSRIVMEAEDIPVDFPVQMAKTQLDYDFTEIGGQPFLLPLRSELRMRDGKVLVKNEAEFRTYRKFGTESSITFDVNEPIPEEKLKETPPAPVKKP
ncbi:MAG: hypothetical protein K2X03_15545 [Bryobacteraceae bacterium]|nr:hypothetical protein [Bryobacteraceae bacterium]